MPGRRATLETRFWEKVWKRAPDECWPWQANKNNMGYGMLRLGGRQRKALAHRISYVLENGPIHDTICVLHRCDNPECVNPAHLFLGTKLDNVRDMDRKCRRRIVVNPDNKPPHKFGSNHAQAKLNEEKVLEMRRMLVDGRSLNFCAQHFGVAKKTVLTIKYRKGWTHI